MSGEKLEHIEGLQEFARAMRELPDKIAKNHLARAVAIPSRLIRDAARAKIASHNKTGLLYRSIVFKRSVSRPLEAQYVIACRHKGKTNAFYWFFLEFGTSHQPATPFLRPAYEENKDQALTLMLNVFKFALETEGAALSWKRSSVG